jgi:hypothetical protein
MWATLSGLMICRPPGMLLQVQGEQGGGVGDGSDESAVGEAVERVLGRAPVPRALTPRRR